jgi:aryl-alcohol dehydrogenase-like predicted oxidoreductase
VWIHDRSRDFHGDEWLARFETARTGVFRALTQLREQGVIKAWGVRVSTVEPCELAVDMAEARPDGFLPSGRLVRRQRQGVGEPVEDNTVHCGRHGQARMAFTCLRLVHGSGLGGLGS